MRLCDGTGDCEKCEKGVLCALLSIAYEEAIRTNDYRAQAKIEELRDRLLEVGK